MFGKKPCNRCGNKISAKFSYCPFCGSNQEKRKERNESRNEGLFFNDDMFSGFMGFPFKALVKQIDKQIKELDRTMREEQVTKADNMDGISISISMGGDQPMIRVKKLGEGREIQELHKTKQAKERLPKRILTEQEAEKLAVLPREEPQTIVRRLSDRIVYEINLPGVKESDIMINKLQNSIEIRAFTKDRAFFKLLPVALPILNYYMKQGKLVLELKPEV